MYTHDEIRICDDCVQFHANGELPPDQGNEQGNEQDERFVQNIETNWGELAGHIVVACEDDCADCDEFSASSCGSCGDKLAGSRHKAVVFCTHEECAPAYESRFLKGAKP